MTFLIFFFIMATKMFIGPPVLHTFPASMNSGDVSFRILITAKRDYHVDGIFITRPFNLEPTGENVNQKSLASNSTPFIGTWK